LNKRLHDLKAKRDSLAEEERNRQSPEQQRDTLLAAVKSHNTELAAIDAQTQREKQNIVTLQNSIAQASQVYNLFFFLNLNTMKPQ
jgi:ketopantoate reductase